MYFNRLCIVSIDTEGKNSRVQEAHFGDNKQNHISRLHQSHNPKTNRSCFVQLRKRNGNTMPVKCHKYNMLRCLAVGNLSLAGMTFAGFDTRVTNPFSRRGGEKFMAEVHFSANLPGFLHINTKNYPQ